MKIEYSTHPATVYSRTWRAKNPEKTKEINRRAKWRRLLRRFGITEEAYADILASQDGVCAVCHGVPLGKKRYLCIDHDHETGAMRGLLCDNCNRGLGLLKDDRETLGRALAYLDHHA